MKTSNIRWLFVPAVAATLFIFFACKKNVDQQVQINNDDPVIMHGGSPHDLMVEQFRLLAEQFMITAKNSANFKRLIYTECNKEVYGDRYVTIDTLLDLNGSYSFWNTTTANIIRSAVDSIKKFNPDEPILFVPFIEDLDIDSLNTVTTAGVPAVVLGLEYDSVYQVCPAYRLDSYDSIVPKGNNINEALAWGSDTWVFGIEESCSDSNMVNNRSVANQGYQSSRTSGDPERGAIIQVTDMGAIEPWIAGEFEFKYIVFNETGTKIKERRFGKVKRKHFRDQQWKDYEDFIAYWNLSVIGDWMIETWIEEDGSRHESSQSLSQTLPPPCTGCPSTTITFTKKPADDHLGQSLVQFTDPITTVYNISFANFKRKN